MINKKIEDIKEEDLKALIDNRALEGKTIEYKKELTINSDPDKKEFLADVTSFANSSGGDLIFGIEQNNQTGAPKLLNGIEVDNVDKEKTRLDNIIRDGVEPRMLGINIKPILLSNSKYAIVVHIPKSWNGPHRVIYGGHAKFYARNSSGKYEMDVDELRVAFNLSETLAEKIRKFRVDRIAKIQADETPVPLFPFPKIVFQLIPVNAFNPSTKYSIESIESNAHDKLPLLYRSVRNSRYNLEGLFTYSDNENGKFSAYTQLYRNGIIEAVDALILKPRGANNTIIKIIPASYEEKLIKATTSYLKLLTEFTVEPPIFIFLSLLGIKNYKIMFGTSSIDSIKSYPIDRELLLLPVEIFQDYNVKVENSLKPLFDLVWNAGGLQKSLNFDENENWITR